jgi:hypothetical protein
MVIVKRKWKTMEKHLKNFKKSFLKLSLIGIIFLLSCGKGEVQQEEAVEWYIKLGLEEMGKQMKKDTQLLTRKVSEDSWDEAIGLCNKIGKSFAKLDLNKSDIPKDFFELKQVFEKSTERLLLACQDKDDEMAKIRLEALKKSCHHCHLIFRKDLDASNKETDFDVAVDKLYKDK